jgi:hypothetical protein
VFARTIGRADSLLLWAYVPATEDSLRRAVTEVLNCPCVVFSVATLELVADAALAALRASGDACTPPYRVARDGVDCEWCLVLTSDPLPPDATAEAWLFGPTKNAAALAVLKRRALLARKRRFNAKGTRVTLGAVLNAPWSRALERNGAAVACLTSRTLNRIMEVVAAAARLTAVGDGRGAE